MGQVNTVMNLRVMLIGHGFLVLLADEQLVKENSAVWSSLLVYCNSYFIRNWHWSSLDSPRKLSKEGYILHRTKYESHDDASYYFKHFLGFNTQ